MDQLALDIFCSVAMSFGMTAMTVFTARTERQRGLVAATFVSGVALVLGLLRWAEVPEGTNVWLGIVGLLMGLASLVGLRVAQVVEGRAKTQS